MMVFYTYEFTRNYLSALRWYDAFWNKADNRNPGVYRRPLLVHARKCSRQHFGRPESSLHGRIRPVPHISRPDCGLDRIRGPEMGVEGEERAGLQGEEVIRFYNLFFSFYNYLQRV